MTSDEGAGEVLAADAPAERTRAPRPAAAIGQSPRRGRTFDTMGWFALVLGSVLLGAVLLKLTPIEKLNGTPLSPMIIAVNLLRLPLFGLGEVWGAVVGLVLVVVGLRAVSRGRRHLQQVLPDLKSVPHGERVVLFLRSFSDDSGFGRTQASRVGRWVVWPPPVTPVDLRTEEEQVSRGLAPFGRMVALGKPSERLPRSGAERSYVPDEQWQSEVLAALASADLALLMVGPGESLRWEVEQAVRRDEPARLVLAVPRDRRTYADFRESVENVFPKGLPEEPRIRGSRVRYVRAAVWFEEDWTPHLEMLTGRFPLFRSVARTEHALPRALREVYERAGLPVPSKGSSSLLRPRIVPASVALFSTSWFGAVALVTASMFYLVPRVPGQTTMSSGDGDVGAFVAAAVGVALLIVALYLVLMLRVLRGGPVAVLLTQALCIGLVGFLLLSGVLTVLLSAGAFSANGFEVTTLLVLLFGLNLIGLAAAAPATVWSLLFRREVREWVDSRA